MVPGWELNLPYKGNSFEADDLDGLVYTVICFNTFIVIKTHCFKKEEK